MRTLNIQSLCRKSKWLPKLSLFDSWTCAMISPQWFELTMFRTNFNGPKDVRAIEVRLYLLLHSEYNCFKKKVKEKSRECHNHKPQPFPDPKKKRKSTNPNKHKPNKRTKSTKISSLFPKRGNRNTKRTKNTIQNNTRKDIQQIAS